MTERVGKYRGKDIKTGEWVFGWLCIWQGITLIFDSPFNLMNNPVEVHPDTVGQFTGKEDRNEKEVYRGDIVDPFFDSGAKGTHLLEVIWNDEQSCYQYKRMGGGVTAFIFSACIEGDYVIGTIHDEEKTDGK